MKRLVILLALPLMFTACTRGGHVYLGNAPLCPTRASAWDANSAYTKGAVVCWNGTAYTPVVDYPLGPPPNKRYWKVY